MGVPYERGTPVALIDTTAVWRDVGFEERERGRERERVSEPGTTFTDTASVGTGGEVPCTRGRRHIYLYIYVSMYLCIYLSMYLYLYLNLYIHTCIYIYVCIYMYSTCA